MCAGLKNEIQLIQTKRCKPGNIFGKKPQKHLRLDLYLGAVTSASSLKCIVHFLFVQHHLMKISCTNGIVHGCLAE